MDNRLQSYLTWAGSRLLFCLLLTLLSPTTVTVAQNTPAPQQEKVTTNDQKEERRNTAIKEDINEFLGYENLLLVRYLSLPYDVVMNSNMISYFVDLGFLLLIFIPFVFLLGSRVPWYQQLIFMAVCTGFLLFSVPSAFLNKEKINLDSADSFLATETQTHTLAKDPLLYTDLQLRKPWVHAYNGIQGWLNKISGPQDHITYPVLFLLLGLALWLLQTRIRHHEPATRILIYFLTIYSFLWLLLSSGIPWYGLLLFPLFFLFIVRGVMGPAEVAGRPLQLRKILLLSMTGIWVLMAFAYRFANYEPKDESRAKLPFMATVAQYQIGQQDQNFVFDRVFPQYRKALQYINQDDRTYVYRVGTLMPFFIPKNDRRVLSDNFLDFFQNLEAIYPNHQELAKALRAYGFRYIIVDLNLSVNDHTPEGSLKAKFQRFMNFLYQNPQLQLIATDRITRGADGRPMFQVFPDGNTVENAGWFAAYQII